MRLYRILTGGDDAAFCKKVSEALNRGWELSGSPSLTFDVANNRVVCGQAVVKEAEGVWNDAMKDEGFRRSER